MMYSDELIGYSINKQSLPTVITQAELQIRCVKLILIDYILIIALPSPMFDHL